MSQPLKCPQCGASEANLLQDNIYQCKFCGSIYEYADAKPVFNTIPKSESPASLDTETFRQLPSKIIRSVIIGVALMIFGIAVSVFFSAKNKIKNTPTTSAKLYSSDNETNSSFTVVNTDKGPRVWTVSRKNSDGLKEVSYFLNQVDATENKIISSTPIGNTITWEQSLQDAYRMEQLKPVGKICWLIYGEKLLGYDVNTGKEIENNEILGAQFKELKNGIAKIEEAYDMEGFKLTTKDGFVYYYAVIANKLITENEYENRNKISNHFTERTEYAFTDEERQQLYKINRNIGELFDVKISSGTLSDLVEDKDNWYKRTYKISSLEEFTPNTIYFKAAVLYYDSSRLVIIYQKELGESSQIFVQCMDVNKNVLWTKSGDETAMFKPFLKSTNSKSFLNDHQLILIQPYQLAVCLDIETGNVKWSFKP